jgi:hypothetical protein
MTSTFERDQARQQRYDARHQASVESAPGAAPDARTLVVDGVEFEVTSIGAHTLTPWPTGREH